MSRYTKTILMMTAAMSIAAPAAAQMGERGEREVRGAAERAQNPRREAIREARRDSREARAARIEAQGPQAQAAAVERRNAEVISRRLARVNDGERITSRRDGDRERINRVEARQPRLERIEDRRERREDWRERGEDRRERIEDRVERREDWRERRDDRRERIEDRVERRDDWRDRRDGRHDRWRDARRHGERERWRNHYRWPRIIVYPSNRYSYRPHWWGQQYYYFDSRYNNYGYDYGSYYRPGYGYYGSQSGSGWAVLYPWLRQDAAGRHWVMWSFDSNRNGRLGNDEARRANRDFERLADRNRDGYLSDSEISFGVEELRDEYRYSYQYG